MIKTILGIAAAIGLIIMLIMINSNIIVLSKNFITFYEKFKGAVGAFIEFGNSYLERVSMKSAGPEYGQYRDQSSAPFLIARNVNYFQAYRLLDNGAQDDTMQVLDLSEFRRFNLVMLEVWVTRDFLKAVIGDIVGEEVNDAELLEYVPPIACASADVYGVIDDNGALGFTVDYNTEIIRLNLEDDGNDIDQ